MAVEEMTGYSTRNKRIKEIAILEIGLNEIRPSKKNTREAYDPDKLQELADSIATHGVIQPIVVRLLSDWDYEIICGERRYRAAQMASLKTIPARVLDGVDDKLAAEIRILENLQRESLNIIEEANSYKQLMDMGYTQAEIGAKVHCSQERISNAIRLLKLPVEARESIRDGRITASHGKVLAGLTEYPELLDCQMKKAMNGATVKELENLYTPEIHDKKLVRCLYPENIGEAATNVCNQCEHRRTFHGGTSWLCLDPECAEARVDEWAEQQEQASPPKAEDRPAKSDLPSFEDLRMERKEERKLLTERAVELLRKPDAAELKRATIVACWSTICTSTLPVLKKVSPQYGITADPYKLSGYALPSLDQAKELIPVFNELAKMDSLRIVLLTAELMVVKHTPDELGDRTGLTRYLMGDLEPEVTE